jgi:gamma-glutamylaminecyclotransferase
MLLFVYGSLKEGFPNFHVNKGRRVPGEFFTVRPYPLYLADGVLPCLLPQPGVGHRVRGQLFEVTADELQALDELERVGEPGGYARLQLEVECAGDPAAGAPNPGAAVQAWAYMQSAARLAGDAVHIGPIAEYTMEHARTLAW